MDLARAFVEREKEVTDRGEDASARVALGVRSGVDAELVAVDREGLARERFDLRVAVLLLPHAFAKAIARLDGQGLLAVTLGELESPFPGRRHEPRILVAECVVQRAAELPQGRLYTLVDALLGVVPGKRDPDSSTAQALRFEADASDQ